MPAQRRRHAEDRTPRRPQGRIDEVLAPFSFSPASLTADHPLRAARASWGPDPQSQLMWQDWETLPRPSASEKVPRKFFVEVFAGKAVLSWTVAQCGIPIAPPIDCKSCPPLVTATNILTGRAKDTLLAWIRSGSVGWIHLATECRTFSRAAQFDGKGPPPIRDAWGNPLPNLTLKQQEDLKSGDDLLNVTEETSKWLTTLAKGVSLF